MPRAKKGWKTLMLTLNATPTLEPTKAAHEMMVDLTSVNPTFNNKLEAYQKFIVFIGFYNNQMPCQI